MARTTAGGEAHLTRKVESVAIPVFQFGTFSDVDLSFFAGATFTFAGRVHTNGNLYLTAQDNGTTTITDKVTAVGDIIRARMQNGLTLATANFDGTLKMATAPNTYRTLLSTEGSADGGTPSVVNPSLADDLDRHLQRLHAERRLPARDGVLDAGARDGREAVEPGGHHGGRQEHRPGETPALDRVRELRAVQGA